MKITTMRGRPLDMGALIAKNQKKVAIGNAKMNARGDIVKPTGEVVKRREAIAQEYAVQAKSVKHVSLHDLPKEVFATPAEAVQAIKEKQPAPKKRKIEDKED